MTIDRLRLFPNQNDEQRPTECAGECVADIVGNMAFLPMDAGYSYAAGLRISGTEPTTKGVNPYAAMLGAVAYGTCPIKDLTFRNMGELYEANFNNYSPIQKNLAKIFVQNGVMPIYTFDDIVWFLNTNKSGIMLTMKWHENFLNVGPDGILPEPAGEHIEHSVAVYGNTIGLEMKPWLGANFGHGGYCYLTKERFDKVFISAYGFDTRAWRWLSLARIAANNTKLIPEILPMMMS